MAILFLEKSGKKPKKHVLVEQILTILSKCLSKIDEAGFVLVCTGEQDFALIDFG